MLRTRMGAVIVGIFAVAAALMGPSAASASPDVNTVVSAKKSGSFSCGGTSYFTSWTSTFGGGKFRWLIGYDTSSNRMAKLVVLEGGSANLFIADWRETGIYNPDPVIGSENNGMTHCHYVRPTSNNADFVVKRNGNRWSSGLAFPPQR